MEGNVYQCGWRKAGRRYRVWLLNDEQFSAVGLTFAKASEELSDMLARKSGDGEALLEFTPAPPTQQQADGWLSPRILMLGCNEYVDTNLRAAGMYTGGFCDRCGSSRGVRTSEPVRLSGDPRGDIVLGGDVSPNVGFVSEELLQLLTARELEGIGLKPTSAVGKRRYFELCGSSLAPWVSFKGARTHPITCWRCPECNRRNLWPQHPRFHAYAFVARADLPRDIPGTVVFGSSSEGLSLCMSDERWHSVVGKTGTNGISTLPIGIVPDEALVRDPELGDPPQ